MRIDFFTLFPHFLDSPLDAAIFQRARDRGLLTTRAYNIRDYTRDKHHVTDDYPYGGGAGMVLKPEPVFEAVESVLGDRSPQDEPLSIILMTPQGRPFNQERARRLSGCNRLLVICGHYEGVDERVRLHLVDEEVSIGDYVLSGGELPALVLADAVVRLIPGVLGSADSILEESHTGGLLEYPHFTRPPDFRNWRVPDVLLSGNHSQIDTWRRKESLRRTFLRRPELLGLVKLSPRDKKLLIDIENEQAEPESGGRE